MTSLLLSPGGLLRQPSDRHRERAASSGLHDAADEQCRPRALLSQHEQERPVHDERRRLRLQHPETEAQRCRQIKYGVRQLSVKVISEILIDSRRQI